MDQEKQKGALLEFMKTFKKAAEEGVFADPEKLNNLIPMKVEWHTRGEMGGSRGISAKKIEFRRQLLDDSEARYSLAGPREWFFHVGRLHNVACISFDELVALMGHNYTVAAPLNRHYKPGAQIARPGPQRMAGGSVFYKIEAALKDRRLINVGFSLDGCVEYVNADQRPLNNEK